MDALASDDEELDDETGKGKGRRKNENEQHRYIEGSIESVAMIDENTFLTGGDSGSICLWSTSKKKPIFTCGVAHGVYDPFEKEGAGENEDGKEDEIKIPPHPRWITALESLRYSNLFASGEYYDFYFGGIIHKTPGNFHIILLPHMLRIRVAVDLILRPFIF